MVAQRAAFDQQFSAHISDVMVENLERYATALCNLAHLLDNVRVSLHYVHNHLQGAEEALLASQNFLEHGVPVEAYQSLDGNPCEIGPDGEWSMKAW